MWVIYIHKVAVHAPAPTTPPVLETGGETTSTERSRTLDARTQPIPAKTETHLNRALTAAAMEDYTTAAREYRKADLGKIDEPTLRCDHTLDAANCEIKVFKGQQSDHQPWYGIAVEFLTDVIPPAQQRIKSFVAKRFPKVLSVTELEARREELETTMGRYDPAGKKYHEHRKDMQRIDGILAERRMNMTSGHKTRARQYLQQVLDDPGSDAVQRARARNGMATLAAMAGHLEKAYEWSTGYTLTTSEAMGKGPQIDFELKHGGAQAAAHIPQVAQNMMQITKMVGVHDDRFTEIPYKTAMAGMIVRQLEHEPETDFKTLMTVVAGQIDHQSLVGLSETLTPEAQPAGEARRISQAARDMLIRGCKDEEIPFLPLDIAQQLLFQVSGKLENPVELTEGEQVMVTAAQRFLSISEAVADSDVRDAKRLRSETLKTKRRLERH